MQARVRPLETTRKRCKRATRRTTGRFDSDDLRTEHGEHGAGQLSPFVGEVKYAIGREHDEFPFRSAEPDCIPAASGVPPRPRHQSAVPRLGTVARVW
ncbi:unannotated protein [freshwater metagenome]|uniref:Unannotated protein n=1 Tax=freshwater metagenome TaxID=449393 RepID=A0A6J7ESR7_9ZZZZ